MPATVFVDGVTVVDSNFLNSLYGPAGHVHDGLDQDGSAPKVDLVDHINVATNAELLRASDTVTDVRLEYRHTTQNPGRMEYILPTLRVRGDLYFGANSDALQDPDLFLGRITPVNTQAGAGLSVKKGVVGGAPAGPRVLSAGAIGVRQWQPGVTSEESETDFDYARALHLDNMPKVRGSVGLTTGGVANAGAGVNYNFDTGALTWNADGRVVIPFQDPVRFSSTPVVSIGSTSSNKSGDAFVYLAQLGFFDASQVEVWVFELTLSTGATRLCTPSAPPTLGVGLSFAAW